MRRNCALHCFREASARTGALLFGEFVDVTGIVSVILSLSKLLNAGPQADQGPQYFYASHRSAVKGIPMCLRRLLVL